MKKALVLSFCMLFCASTAFGQAGGILLWSGTDCNATCNEIGVISVDVFHVNTPGAKASAWKVDSGGGAEAIGYLGDVVPVAFLYIGNTQTGISLDYGFCYASYIHLVTIEYYCPGSVPPCSYLEVVPATPGGKIEVTDCAGTNLSGVGSKLFFNNDGTCGRPCGLPTRNTTWGEIKTLYR